MATLTFGQPRKPQISKFIAQDPDAPVQNTNDDATMAKISAIRMGYFEDEFLESFVSNTSSLERRPPMFNRGYWARVNAIRKLVTRFISCHNNNNNSDNMNIDTHHTLDQPNNSSNNSSTCDCQIVSLGSGFDSLYFYLKSKGIYVSKYVELDMMPVIKKKITTILNNTHLQSIISENFKEAVKTADEGTFLDSGDYAVCSVDLRITSQVEQIFEKVGLNNDKPTLFLSECVLIYLDKQDSDRLIEMVNQKMKKLCFILYEQIGADDPFGKMMISNLEKRGCPLRGLTAYPTRERQIERFSRYGFDVECEDMNCIYSRFFEREERQRAERLEHLDELEEWAMLMAHYCIVVAVKKEYSMDWKGLYLLQQKQ